MIKNRNKKKKTRIVLPPLKINEGDALWYRKKLAILTKKMMDEYISEIRAYYRLHRSYLVNDDNPIAGLQAIIDRISSKWYRIFDIESEPLAKTVVDNAQNFSNSQFFEIKKKNPFLLNNPKDLRQTAKIVKASIAENVSLIKSIPVEYHDKILGSVMRAAGSGGNLKQLTDDLSKLTHQTKKRIHLIAHDQNAKATALINNQNSIDAGFTHAEWRKSIAGKTHRKSHAEADGKVFELKKGCLIDGEYILPREEINCKCSMSLVINL